VALVALAEPSVLVALVEPSVLVARVALAAQAEPAEPLA